jgi:tight adherence protein C
VLVGVGLTVWVHPMLSLALGVGAVGWYGAHTRRATRRAAREVVDELPDLVDVVALAVQGGATIRLAVAGAAAAGTGRGAAALADALGRTDRGGARLADALEALPDHLGEPSRPFVRALVASERYGVPVAPALDLVGRDLRDQRRRRAEEDIRRVPVRLVFPLVCCILPAFVVLTVVPLLLASFGQLPR